MNEFIVWDNKENKINDFYPIAVKSNGDILWCTPTYGKWETAPKGRFTILPYIGKTDIEDNKIYADYSIVEFRIKFKGVFKGHFWWNKITLRYMIEIYREDGFKTLVEFNFQEMDQFKIIGTIQENKHLLGDEDDT